MISLVNLAAALLVIALLPGSTARLARLVTNDSIAAPLRLWVAKKWGAQSMAADLITCHWCVAVWASLLTNTWGWTLIGYSKIFPAWMCVGLAVLAIPAVAYHASRMIDREDA